MRPKHLRPRSILMRSFPKSFLPMPIVLALLLSGAKSAGGQLPNPGGQQHNSPTPEKSKQAEQRQQEPLVPFGALQAAQDALNEALHTIRSQEDASAKNS